MKEFAEIDNTNLLDKPGRYEYSQQLDDINELRVELADRLKEQYIGFKNLNIDIMGQYPNLTITNELLEKFLIFFDSNIINIALLDTILNNNDLLYSYSSMIYKHFYVNFEEELIKPLMAKFKLTNKLAIISEFNYDELRINILAVLTNKIDVLINLVAINENLKPQLLTYNFLLDLYNTELEDFAEKFLIPYINRE